MLDRNIISIACIGSVLFFFIVMIMFAIFSTAASFIEESNTIVNFRNFSIANLILVIGGSVFFIISVIFLYMIFSDMGLCGEKMPEIAPYPPLPSSKSPPTPEDLGRLPASDDDNS